MHVSQSGENIITNSIYMDDASLGQMYEYYLNESVIFDQLLYRITGYQLGTDDPTWLKVDNTLNKLYGIPQYNAANETLPLTKTFTIEAIDITNGTTTVTCYLTIVNKAAQINQDISITVCTQINQWFYYQIPFEFQDQDDLGEYNSTTQVKIDNGLTIPFNGIYFDGLTKSFVGYPNTASKHLISIYRNDNYANSSGDYKIYLEVLSGQPS